MLWVHVLRWYFIQGSFRDKLFGIFCNSMIKLHPIENRTYQAHSVMQSSRILKYESSFHFAVRNSIWNWNYLLLGLLRGKAILDELQLLFLPSTSCIIYMCELYLGNFSRVQLFSAGLVPFNTDFDPFNLLKGNLRCNFLVIVGFLELQ